MHLLTFCIEAGLVCKRTINFKLETQVKKHSLHFIIIQKCSKEIPIPNVFGYHSQKFSDSNSKMCGGSGKKQTLF